ncbi:Poly [ADP-ribose] polymerase 3 [Acorus calamus]|uniref:Poly [ADP-ribose] polymerase n=1 Tax=Acorus calamus TaxID=4465 RepID=A0AAV9DHC9_ACOCL|nr:Poly [ADP-ribose] polymerase 3 [Acorus calamus]
MRQSHAEDREGKTGAKKQKSESKAHEAEAPATHTRNERPKPTNGGRSSADVAAEFYEFCKATREHLSIEEMRKILEANNQDSSGHWMMCEILIVTSTSQDIMFYGPLEKCLICNGQIDCNGSVYQCNGCYSEWTTCKYSTRDPKRREDPLKLPDELKNNSMASDQYWRKQIEKHGGKVSNGVADSIDKQEVQPMEAYDVISDLPPYGKGIPLDKQDPNEESIQSLSAELKLYGKRGVYKDSKLEEEGGHIFERDGIIYNCAFSVCDAYCIMQLIVVPENRLHLYYKKARMGDDTRVEEKASTDGAVEEFVRLFKDLTGNEFEPWEREKTFQKKPHKFFPIDMVFVQSSPFKHRILFRVCFTNSVFLVRMMGSMFDTEDSDFVSLALLLCTASLTQDPLFDRYKNLHCSITLVEQQSEDYKMILDYLNKTYEPVKLGDLFGRGSVCYDAAAEAARYGFTAVDRPEGFLVLAVVSLGDRVTEMSSAPEDTKKLESKKAGVKGLGRKKTDESEHFVWKDDVKVPCGRIMASEHKESPLEYNEYTIYDPGQEV